MNFNEAKYKKVTNTVSGITLQLILRNYHLLSFVIVLKLHFYNYIKTPLKYFSIFQLHICVRLHLLNTLTKTSYHNRGIRTEVGKNLIIFN